MTPLGHELIRASAGTGKTFQLTSRYLRLLLRRGEPERIVALTFTRKAAGEFFTKIFQRLADGADSAEGAAKLSRELGLSVDPTTCRQHLRLLLERLHRLQLSTYDAFFTRIVQNFPYELGLAAAPTLLSTDERNVQIERTQRALSHRTNVDAEFLREFWHACKRATMGVETKTITEIIADFIKGNHSLFFEAADPRLWGDPATIWSGACPWLGTDVDLAAEARALRQTLSWGALKPKQRQFWEEYLAQLAEWKPPAEMPPRVAAFTKKFLAVYGLLDTGTCEVTIQSKQTLTRAEGQIVKRISRYCFSTILAPRLEATQGIYDLVRLFEEIYAEEVRRAGRITLEDATLLLAGSNAHGDGLQDPELRERLGYRLDASFDHWLLDEFQDTSRAQWRAVAELLDEVLQDAEQQRTFFAVGDTKQSIYGWRGSDDRLFDRVQDQYDAVLNVRALSESHRSVPAVLAMVNQVFGRSADLAAIVGDAVAERWSGRWNDHSSAARLSGLPGHACLIHAPEEDEHCFATVLALLGAMKPLEKGLSVAVLTRENDTADALVEHLRAHRGPACSLAANVKPGQDNVVAAGLRSLLTLAAHPADTQAWWHLRLSPMGPQLQTDFGTGATLSRHLLEIWSEHGLAGLVDYWRELCAAHLDPADAFNHGRLELCRQAARELDAAGETDLDAYVRGLDGIELREHDTPGQVAVMTIHKAKGLDWDIVIVTDLAGKTLSERRRGGLAVQRDEAGEVEWICEMPAAEFAGCDPVLGAQIEAAGQDAAFERLCALYVGMTRARRGLCVVTHAATGESQNYCRLLDTTLGADPQRIEIGGTPFQVAWQHGQPDWFACLAAPPAERRPIALPLLVEAERRRDRRPKGVRPSEREAEPIRLATGARAESIEFGREVHRALARVEWLGDPPAADAATIEQAVAGISPAAAAAVQRALGDPETRAVFQRSQAGAEVWRELPFEWVRGSEWITGRFDRVVIEKTEAGAIASAMLVDFKTTGRGRTVGADAFAGQMDLYREAVAALCGIAPSAVQVKVVLIQPGSVAAGEVSRANPS